MKLSLEHLPADVFGLSPLARAALAGGPAFEPLAVPRRTDEISAPEDRHDEAEREALVVGLRQALEPLEPPQRVVTSLNVLARAGTSVVVTGQQPGFLGGPLYCLYKAVQACKLAQELSRSWGRPVVPVFWNHADDHDVAEVHHSFLVNHHLDLQKVALAGLSSGRQPLSRILMDEEAQRLPAVRSLLAQLLGDSPHVEAALQLLFPRAGETLARSLTRAFTQLLGEHGLVVVEPDWIRAPLSRALADLVARDPRAALDRGAARLTELGFGAPIDPSGAALVYHLEASGRRPLRSGGEGFRYDDEPGSRTGDELAAEIVQDPDAWSPGALMRPLVQDAVLPVAAYVGGFGELEYHAELGPLREAAGLPLTPFVARVCCTQVEPETRLALARLETTLTAVIQARGAFEAGVAEDDEPAVIDEVRRSAQRAAAELLEYRTRLGEIDRALAVNLKRTADQIEKQVDKLLDKARRVVQNRSGKGRRHVRRLNNALCPTGKAQERVLGPLPFLARYGTAWVDALYNEFPAVASEHLAVQIELDEETRA